jgi:hypothetical protein
MKRRHVGFRRQSIRAVCTVPAAALMLGVSHAATVGFNFQTHYCSLESYSGSPVTATAFGIETNGWQSLQQMDTGYGCDPGPFSLNQVIDKTSSGGGLNPLPNGSLNVSWSGYVANVSGFGGYDRNPPHFTFGGNGFHPGEEQVYWGFIRDGVNFGPGSSGGNNNQPGYSLDISGLKSLFTNSSFVVELIASSDSLSALTNAFIIDATLSTTQSVTYPNIPPIGNVGDTAWPRGVGGGLSTVSGPVDTDHLMIIGNRAQHSAGPPAFNNASTIAGFIITDKPVVSMSPQPVFATPGDTVTLRAIAVGVPPLSLQWRKDSVPIANATNLTYVIPGITSGGNFDLLVTNLYGSTTSKVAAVTVDQLTAASGPNFTLGSNPSGTRQDGGLLGGVKLLASSLDAAGTNRIGVAEFTATNAGQVVVSGTTTNFDSVQGTIMFWMHSGAVSDTNGNEGAMLFDRRTDNGGGIVFVQHDDGSFFAQAQFNFVNVSSGQSLTDDRWHHVAATYDTAVGVQLYVDGLPDNFGPNKSPTNIWTWPVGQEIELGKSHDTYWRAYDGLLDDVRLYNRQLTAAEIASIFSTDALVDTNALKLRLNFDGPVVSGITATWGSNSALLQSADNVQGPFTDIPFATVPPYRASTQPGAKFYRYRHTPVSLITNPYDM